MPTGHIVAMGGGGFSMEPENPLLDGFVLSLARSDDPRVLFLSPSGDDGYALRFYEGFGGFACRPGHLNLFRLPTADLRGLLLEQDVIYVGGGNTRSMMALWREWGLPSILADCHAEGAVLAGVSAGAICWFEWGLTDSVPGTLGPLACTGLLPGSCAPHYDGEAERRPTYRRLVGQGGLPAGFGIDDSAALHFAGGELVEAVCSVPGRGAWRVERAGDGASETRIEARGL